MNSRRIAMMLLGLLLSTATVWTQGPFTIESIRRTDGLVRIRFEAASNTYHVLRSGLWVTNQPVLMNVLLGTSPIREFADATLEVSGTQRFYHVLSLPLNAPSDLDADGLDDVQELMHSFLNPLVADDVLGDPDADRYPTLYEIRHGSDPTNAASRPSAQRIVVANLPNQAEDAADQPAYQDGWGQGDQGGTGFGPWTLTRTQPANTAVNGFFVGSSTLNGFGTGAGINTSGKAWGMYANSGNRVAAYRSLPPGGMQAGQTLYLQMDNGFIDDGGVVGFSLRHGQAASSPEDYAAGAQFLFEFTGGTTNYVARDARGVLHTGRPFSSAGLNLSFTLTDSNAYALSFSVMGGSGITTLTGALSGATLDSLALYNRNAGGAAARDLFFNSLRLAVSSNRYTTLQEAIDAATDYDIVEVRTGVYKGVGNRGVSFRGKRLLVLSSEGPAATVLDAEGADRGFLFLSEGASSVLDGFTVRNGYGDNGGGINCSQASPTLRRCVLANNQCAGDGGGLHLYRSSAEVTECAIIGNTAGDDGGGVFSDGLSARFTRCTILSNVTTGGSTSHGGGLHLINSCTPSFASTLIAANRTTGQGGGTWQDTGARPAFVNCTIADNVAATGGGGSHSASATASGTFLNSILWGNVPTQTSGASVVSYSDVQGGAAGIGNIQEDPRLQRTYRLGPFSPCIDAGRAADAPAQDRDGETRWDHPVRTNAWSAVDMGADEYVDGDGDAMADTWETAQFGSLERTGLDDADLTGGPDGLPDREEFEQDCDPHSADSDGDGVRDGDEVYQHRTSPLRRDSDGDELPDGWEIAYHADPVDGADFLADPDGDRIVNLYEYVRGTDPTQAASRPPVLAVAPPALDPVARDDAGEGAYNRWWATGQNGGSGFLPWVFRTQSGGGSVSAFLAYADALPSLNSIATGIRGWGCYAPSPLANQFVAFRSFVADLATGLTFSVEFEHGPIDYGGSCGLVLRTGHATAAPSNYNAGARFELGFVGGSNCYFLVDSAGYVDTGVPFTDGGLRVRFVLRTADTYDLHLTDLARRQGFSFTNRILRNSGPLQSLALYNRGTAAAAWGPVANVYFNALRIEASTAPYPNIQEALDAAPSHAVLELAAGTYQGSRNRELNFHGKPLLLVSAAGAERTVIDAQGQGRAFHFQNGEGRRSVLRGVTVRGGSAGEGGGLRFQGASPSLLECVVQSNTAQYGGGLYSMGGAAPFVLNCLLIGNRATSYGGAINNFQAVPTFQNCRITRNVAGTAGGGVQNSAGVTSLFQNCTIVGNLGWGLSAGSPVLRNTIVWNNTPGALVNATPRLTHCVMQGGGTGEVVLVADPLLTPVSLRLTAASPCIDAGTEVGACSFDDEFEGRRDDPAHAGPSMVDIGADEFVDTDGDAMADRWERAFFGALAHDGTEDSDAQGGPDGLSDAQEYARDASPAQADTDGDQLTDGEEVNLHGTWPALADTDGDGLADGNEMYADATHGDDDGWQTDPRDPDSDHDGYADGPLDPDDTGPLCSGTDPRPLDAAQGAVLYAVISPRTAQAGLGEPYIVDVQMHEAGSGLPARSVREFQLLADGGGIFAATGVVHGSLAQTSLQFNRVYARTDPLGRFSIMGMGTDYSRITFAVSNWSCGGVLAAATNRLASIQVPYESIACVGRRLTIPSGVDATEVRISDVIQAVGGLAPPTGGSTWNVGGHAFQHVRIGKRGYMFLGQQGLLSSPELDLQSTTNPVIAPFLDDLVFTNDSRIFVFWRWGTEPIFTVEWDRLAHARDPAARVTFQVNLYQDSRRVRLAYEDLRNGTNLLADGREAVVGLRAAPGYVHVWNQPLESGQVLEVVDTARAFLDVDADDQDGDFLPNADETAAGTSPQRWDTDGDRMGDGWEQSFHPALNPLLADAEGDADGDGYINLIEYYLGSDPTRATQPAYALAETDKDGMPDAWENEHGLNPGWAGDGLLDMDADWYVNTLEYALGGDPADAADHGYHPYETNGGVSTNAFP